MDRRRLGRTDLEVSVIGLGGIPIQGLDDARATDVIAAAVDAGIDFFDSARGYTDSEAKLGRALAPHRDRVTLATKSMARGADEMRADVERSLGELATDRIDLYQLHNVASAADLERVLGPGGALEALERARDAGAVRWIGITGHSRPILVRALASGRFDTVQHPLNPIEVEWLEEVVPAAREAEAGVIAMKPAAGGALDAVPAALRWSLHRGADAVIPGMDAVEQVRANAAVGRDLRPPDAEELAALERDRRAWGGQFCRRCGYCKPCPNDLDIPALLLLEAYYTRYALRDWALARLAGLEKRYADCAACGECVERCPYRLPIPELMAAAAERVV